MVSHKFNTVEKRDLTIIDAVIHKSTLPHNISLLAYKHEIMKEAKVS